MFTICRKIALYLCAATLISVLSVAQQKPKNIILMIGDGMGHNYVSTALLKDKTHPLFAFPITGLSIAVCADKLVTDSAAGASAIATGQLVNYESVSVSPNGEILKSIFDSANEQNLATGIVVTSRLTNATPAAFYANTWKRNAEDSIAFQFLSSNIDVALGGGRDKFLTKELGGIRTDGINLISELQKMDYAIANSFEELASLKSSNKIVGLFEMEGLPKAVNRDYGLDDLSDFALKHLSKRENGFLLMIEGSQIDWAGHDTDAVYLFNEMDDFSEAIKICLDFAKNDGETLVIVTADHETGGMAIMDGNRNGTNLKIEFLSGDHTAGTVSVFAFGPGSENFSGTYSINLIGKKIFRMLDE